jgi:nucleoside phosphorylase
MKLLIAAAVEAEMAPFRAQTGIVSGCWNDLGGHRVWLAYTDAGPVAAAFHIQRLVSRLQPDRVIQAGVCGCYADSGLKVGRTVEVVRERLADLGAMIGDAFRDIFPEQEVLENPHRFPGVEFPRVAGLTVSTGCHPCIDQIRTLHVGDRAAVETMEGYSLFYVCRQMNVPFTELRTVSNVVSPDRGSWDLPLAAKNLAGALIETVTSY